jgi:hypothetical protein
MLFVLTIFKLRESRANNGSLRLLFAAFCYLVQFCQIIFEDFFLFLVLVISDRPGSKALLQNIKRRLFPGPLAGDVVWDCKYPKDKDHPDDPPNEVHTTKAVVKHGF